MEMEISNTTHAILNMQSYQDIEDIYQDFFSDQEEDEDVAIPNVLRLMEGDSLKEWRQVPFANNEFCLKVDDVEKQLLQVAIN